MINLFKIKTIVFEDWEREYNFENLVHDNKIVKM